MRFLIILLLSFKLSAQPFVSEPLRPYVAEYLSSIKQAGLPVTRNYHSLDSIVLREDTLIFAEGVWALGCSDTICNKVVLATKPALLYYDVPDSLYYRHIIYHELGHYLFQLEHYEGGIGIMVLVADYMEWYDWKRVKAEYIWMCRNKKNVSLHFPKPSQVGSLHRSHRRTSR